MGIKDLESKTDFAMAALALVSIFGLAVIMVAQVSGVHVFDEVRGPVYQIELVGEKSLVSGSFKSGQLGELSEDGSFLSVTDIDESQFNGQVGSLAYYKSQIFVGGHFTAYGQSIVGHLAKLNSEGQLDSDFLRNMGTGFDDRVNLVHLLSNGDLIVAGEFRSYNGHPAEGVAYIRNNGSINKDFQPSQGLNGKVLSVSQGPKGDLVLAGDFTQWKSEPKPYVFHISL